MADLLQFVVVDNHPDNRFLLTKTLKRRIPDAVIIECQDSDTALSAVTGAAVAAVVVHRARDLGGILLIEQLRGANATVPILCVSGVDLKSEALKAGANAYLPYDAWLRVGSVVAELISSKSNEEASASDEKRG